MYRGQIKTYGADYGWGFINSPDLQEPAINGDIYFRRTKLPYEWKDAVHLVGLTVDVEVEIAPDRRARAIRMWILDKQPPPRSRPTHADKDVPRPLSKEKISKIIQFVKDAGDVDLAAITKEFPGVKKAQLEKYLKEHLTLVPDQDAGGHFRIVLKEAETAEEPAEMEEEFVASPDEDPDAEANEDGESGQRRKDSRRHPDEEAEEAEALVPKEGEKFVGHIQSFDPRVGYGFVKCDEVLDKGDVYFRKKDLSREAAMLPRDSLVGEHVTLDIFMTSIGTIRGRNIELAEVEEEEARPNQRSRQEQKEAADADLPPLELETVETMTQLLEDKGGVMNYGNFSNAFKGVKKAQLEPHFQMVCAGKDYGGKWLIALPGVEVDPATVEEDGKPPVDRPRRIGPIQPSSSMWLIGCIKRWDPRKGFGFLVAHGADDVMIHRDDLPEELQGARSTDLVGAEFAFELCVQDNGKMKATEVRALISPDPVGGWQLRRVP